MPRFHESHKFSLIKTTHYTEQNLRLDGKEMDHHRDPKI